MFSPCTQWVFGALSPVSANLGDFEAHHRELMKLSQRVRRAHEEVQRCHIAIRRLYTAILDEDDTFKDTLSRLQNGDPCIYKAVCDFITRRQQVNDLLLTRLTRFTNSPNYSGNLSRGVRVGSNEPIQLLFPL